MSNTNQKADWKTRGKNRNTSGFFVPINNKTRHMMPFIIGNVCGIAHVEICKKDGM